MGRELFTGFELSHIDTGKATLRVCHSGSGPTPLFLYGLLAFFESPS